MGGATSHFCDTDWDTVDGGVKETLDGAPPNAAHSILCLIKHKSLVNQRSCELRDETQALLYITSGTEGTTKDFDLLDPQGTKLFHIHTESSLHSQWIIYSYNANTSSFDEQKPIHAKETKGLHVEDPLYLKLNVTIAWDKYHGVIRSYEKSEEDPQGRVSHEDLLRIEEIKSITPQFQSFVPPHQLLLNALHHPQQSLCGYWIREHTAKTDTTKMHLAKGTDVALHCILTVIANIVHVERQSDNS